MQRGSRDYRGQKRKNFHQLVCIFFGGGSEMYFCVSVGCKMEHVEAACAKRALLLSANRQGLSLRRLHEARIFPPYILYSKRRKTQPVLYDIRQCFSTAGPWHQSYRAARSSPGIYFSFLSNFHE